MKLMRFWPHRHFADPNWYDVHVMPCGGGKAIPLEEGEDILLIDEANVTAYIGKRRCFVCGKIQ